MISKIIFNIGDPAAMQRVQSFCFRNRKVLEKNNFIYPEPLSEHFPLIPYPTARFFNDCPHHDFLSAVFIANHKTLAARNGQDGGPQTIWGCFNEYVRTLKQRYAGEKEYTLCFSWPSLLFDYGNARKIGAWFKAFANLFTGASLHCFASLSPQDILFENQILYRMLFFDIYILDFYDLRWKNTDYFKLGDELGGSFSPPNIAFSLGGEQNWHERSLKEFISFAGLRGLENLNLEAPATTYAIGRDIFEFIDSFKRATFKRVMSEQATLVAWEREPEFLAAGKEPAALFCPELRERIRSHYATSNAAFCAGLGLADFLYPATTDNWVAPPKATTLRSREIYLKLSPQSRVVVRQALGQMEKEELWHAPRTLWQAARPEGPLRGQVAKQAEPAKVAVLTMTYNHVKYIEENIKAVISQQTDFKVRHIIADDASTDGTQDILRDYAARHPHITLILRGDRDYYRAQRSNTYRLFSMVDSPYAALCDGDDYFCDPLKLQRQVDFLEANPRCSICFHPVSVIWENKAKPDGIFPFGRDLPPHKPPYTLTDLVRWNFMSTASVMYRWRFANGLPRWFFEKALPGDWYWHLLHAEKGRIGMLPDLMAVYRRHDGGLWSYAETDHVKHTRLYGLQKLRHHIEIDSYFKGRFRNILKESILWEFSMLYLLSVKHGEPDLLEQAVREFPEWTQDVLEILRKNEE